MSEDRDISVEPELTPEIVATISLSLAMHIAQAGVHIHPAENEALKKEIQDHVFAGGRAESLSRKLHAKFGVEKKLALEFAHRVSSVVLSKYRELRYRAIGCVSYKWSTSHDSRVCARCQELADGIFFWTNPPEGGHPGECLSCPDEAGCRCVAIPVLNFDK